MGRETEMDELTRRVEALERDLAHQRRTSRRLRAGLFAAVALVGLVAADAPMRLLRADRIEVGPPTAPTIVLGEGLRGPSLELRDREGNLATLTARGLAFDQAEPVEPPTLADPGTGTADVRTARVTVEGKAWAVEVTCPGTGFRERTPVLGQAAVVRVPSGGTCYAYLKGSENLQKFPILPDGSYRCVPKKGCSPE